MRYLITSSTGDPFFTDKYRQEMFNEKIKMIVYDLLKSMFTKDGINWNFIHHL